MFQSLSRNSIRLINKDVTDREIRLLARWRRKVQPLWRETFKVTFKGTKKWVMDIIDDLCKRLYFVYRGNTIIGQIGYDYIDRNEACIGCVIRGRGKRDGSMGWAVRQLIDMAKDMNIPHIYLKVRPFNTSAIAFYTKHGFKITQSDIVNKFLIMTYENSRPVGQDAQ